MWTPTITVYVPDTITDSTDKSYIEYQPEEIHHTEMHKVKKKA